MKWLIYGYNGWLGSFIIKYIKEIDIDNVIISGKSRIDDLNKLEKEISQEMPDRIICAVGRTSGPGFSTIDYLEQKGKLVDNVRDNLFGPISLVQIANSYNIHVTYIGTGCIFNGLGLNNDGYLENDLPDFFGSSYSVVKGFTDRLMKNYNNVLNVRIRMPITDDLNSKNFIIKILNYKKICSISNSMTVIPELFPLMIDMAIKKETGTINLVNPGLISHNEILELVKEYKNKDLIWENFSLEEQRLILLADRSNNLLNTNKLESKYNVLNIKDSIKNIILNLNV